MRKVIALSVVAVCLLVGLLLRMRSDPSAASADETSLAADQAAADEPAATRAMLSRETEQNVALIRFDVAADALDDAGARAADDDEQELLDLSLDRAAFDRNMDETEPSQQDLRVYEERLRYREALIARGQLD